MHLKRRREIALLLFRADLRRSGGRSLTSLAIDAALNYDRLTGRAPSIAASLAAELRTLLPDEEHMPEAAELHDFFRDMARRP